MIINIDNRYISSVWYSTWTRDGDIAYVGVLYRELDGRWWLEQQVARPGGTIVAMQEFRAAPESDARQAFAWVIEVAGQHFNEPLCANIVEVDVHSNEPEDIMSKLAEHKAFEIVRIPRRDPARGTARGPRNLDQTLN